MVERKVALAYLTAICSVVFLVASLYYLFSREVIYGSVVIGSFLVFILLMLINANSEERFDAVSIIAFPLVTALYFEIFIYSLLSAEGVTLTIFAFTPIIARLVFGGLFVFTLLLFIIELILKDKGFDAAFVIALLTSLFFAVFIGILLSGEVIDTDAGEVTNTFATGFSFVIYLLFFLIVIFDDDFRIRR